MKIASVVSINEAVIKVLKQKASHQHLFKQLECRICKRNFPTRKLLMKHVKTHVENARRCLFQSNNENGVFKKKKDKFMGYFKLKNIKKEKLDEDEAKEKPVKKWDPSKDTTPYSSLSEGSDEDDESCKNSCPICGRKFKESYNLSKHLTFHYRNRL